MGPNGFRELLTQRLPLQLQLPTLGKGRLQVLVRLRVVGKALEFRVVLELALKPVSYGAQRDPFCVRPGDGEIRASWFAALAIPVMPRRAA